jgi:hypothetical protein
MAEHTADFAAAAAALGPALRLFDSLAGRHLGGAWLRHEHGSLAEVVFDFGALYLAAIADGDCDTLRIELRTEETFAGFSDGSSTMPWSHHLGQPFSWGWLTINKQGYIDGALLGFGDDIYPKIALNVIASEIKVGAVIF